MDTLAWIVTIHGVIGVLTLAASLVALAVPKRRGLHGLAGRVALGGMALGIALAVPAIVARANLFLVGMGLLVISHGVVAWWAVRARPRGPIGAVGRAVVIAAGIGFTGFAALGLRAALRGSGMGGVAIGMAVIGAVLLRAVWRYRGPVWVGLHVHGAAGFLIAGVTAFAAATGPRLLPGVPVWLLWTLPTLVLTPAFVLMGRRQEARRARR